MNCLLTAAALLTGTCLYAAEGGSYLSAPPPAEARLNEVVRFSPRANHHFNLKAPQRCGASAAFELKAASLKCQFSSGGPQAVSLKVCDDKNTYCVSEDFTVKVAGPAASAAAAMARNAADQADPLPGFVLNDTAAALRQAKKEGKLLFIDFFGRWCPPCRLMEDTVLNQDPFLEASSGMVRLGLDVDAPQAREWLARFKVSGYPTYLVADARLREIGRVSGSMNLPAFNAWLRAQQGFRDRPIAAAKAAAASLDEAGRLRVAKAYLHEKDWAAARRLLDGIGGDEAAYLHMYASVAQAEADSKDAAKASSAAAAGLGPVYEAAIRACDGSDGRPARIAVLEWLDSLYKLDPAAAKPWLGDAEALAARLLASAAVAEEGYTPEDTLVSLADTLDKAGLPEKAAELYSRAAAGFAAQADKVTGPEAAKGLRLNQARYLVRAGRLDEAAAIYAGLTENFPKEYAFHRAYAGLLRQQKKFTEAIREAGLAADLSYGDIRLSIVLAKAQMEAEAADKAAAIKTIRGALASADLPADRKRGTHGVYGRLKEYLRELEAGK
ncbi:MAG: thioredoxin family protein [Elusimicrobiales bacterium]